MIQVFLYSMLLISGMAISQIFDLSSARFFLTSLTIISLAYIMIQVGLEFTINKKKS